MYQRKRTMSEIIDKIKGKINQAGGDLTGNKRRQREGERNERKAKSKTRWRKGNTGSTEESEIDTEVQQSKGRKLPWVLKRSLSSSCWFYCLAGAAVTIGLDDGRCHFSHYFDTKNQGSLKFCRIVQPDGNMISLPALTSSGFNLTFEYQFSAIILL